MSVHETAQIHPMAVVEPGAVIGAGARVGPFCVVGPEVTLGEGVALHSHVAVAGWTQVGDGTVVYPFASVGHAPQDLKYRGERTALVIGARNRIRENVTLNPGTEGGGGVTRIGDDNLLMVGVHVGHDCTIGNGCIMANCATLGGHVVLEDNVVLGGLSAVQQFVRVGRGAMIGGMAGAAADVIPFGMVIGERAHLAGLNLTGLKRRGFERETIHGLRAAYAAIFDMSAEGSLQERAAAAAERHAGNALVREVTEFLSSGSSRSFLVPAG